MRIVRGGVVLIFNFIAFVIYIYIFIYIVKYLCGYVYYLIGRCEVMIYVIDIGNDQEHCNLLHIDILILFSTVPHRGICKIVFFTKIMLR